MRFFAFNPVAACKFHQTVTMALAAVFLAFSAWAAEVTWPISPLAIGKHRFTVEVATTGQQLEQGLMFRKQLPEDRGMLFVFPQEQQLAMWMKNTLIPLDMLFIDKNGRIIYIARDTVPQSLDVISYGKPGKAVLELAGGVTKKLGINVGDKVVHETFTADR